MIQAFKLSKQFGQLRAVDELDLDVRQGEFFCFLGPNAAGKTTTIKMLTGLLRPSGGRCAVGGFDVQREPEAAKALLAYVPDFPFLYDKLTVREFMQFVGDLFNLDREAAGRTTGELFEKFGLNPYANELTENLSHGTKQRLAIASALLHEPKVLIIDEPMVGLDPHHARVVKDILKERSLQGMTVFVSTHQLSVAEEMADRIGIMHQGRFVAVGTREELRQQSGSDGVLENSFLALTAQEANFTEERAAVK